MRKRRKIALALALSLVAFGGGGCAGKIINDGVALYNSGQPEAALEKWLPLANAGDPTAQNNVGSYYNNHANNPVIASQWFLLSAQKGYVPAMTNLARIQLANGNTEAALSWLMLAARWGDPGAMAMLAQRGYQIPAADLAVGAAQQQTGSSQATNDGWHALGCALAGGCATQGVAPATPSRTFECKLSPYKKDAFGQAVVVCE